MNLHPWPRTESWHSRYQSTKGTLTTSQRCSAGDLILGTDFRHAVEFSRSGRAKNPALRPSSSAACPTLRRARLAVTSGDLTAAPGPLGPVSLGAERKLRGRGGLVKPVRVPNRHQPGRWDPSQRKTA